MAEQKNFIDMQVFIPYPEPIKVARCLDKKRLNKQIIECHQIISAASGKATAWASHPVVKMYKNNLEWLQLYTDVLEYYRDGREDIAIHLSNQADMGRPSWMTEALCNSHKRRLAEKDPNFYYKFFKEYGISIVNYYVVDSRVIGYMYGKYRSSRSLEEFNNAEAWYRNGYTGSQVHLSVLFTRVSINWVTYAFTLWGN